VFCFVYLKPQKWKNLHVQRSNLIIMPMVFVSFIMGTLAEYEQVHHHQSWPF
jgi:hypothetical protein